MLLFSYIDSDIWLSETLGCAHLEMHISMNPTKRNIGFQQQLEARLSGCERYDGLDIDSGSGAGSLRRCR